VQHEPSSPLRSPRLPRWALPVIAVLVIGGAFVGGLIFGQGSPDQRSRPQATALAPAVQQPDIHDEEGLPYPEIARIEIAEIQVRRNTGTLLLVDARSAEQYDAGHAEGALLLGTPELDARLASLDEAMLIVTYCT
jgi:hypothetical protein